MSKLGLDRDRIDLAKNIAGQISAPLFHHFERHTSVAVERTLLRLLGVEGSHDEKPSSPAPQGSQPLVNAFLEKLTPAQLSRGACYWLGLAAAQNPRMQISTVARKVSAGEVSLKKIKEIPLEEVSRLCQKLWNKQLERLRRASEKKSKRPAWRKGPLPLRYVSVGSGDIHEDIAQAQLLAEMGADIIAIKRSSGQGLLDYVPEGPTVEGCGGTLITQENIRLMRQALDKLEKKLGRRISLCLEAAGLCTPELTLIAALEGVDFLLLDLFEGVLGRDINFKRNVIDQFLARRLAALSGIHLQSGVDRYGMGLSDSRTFYQGLARNFLALAFTRRTGLEDHRFIIGHGLDVNTQQEDWLLKSFSELQLLREVFPYSTIKLVSAQPTHHSENLLSPQSYYFQQNLLFAGGALCGPTIQHMGCYSPSGRAPQWHDWQVSFQSSQIAYLGLRSAREEMQFLTHGKVARQARQALDDAINLLKKIKFRGLGRAFEEGAFLNLRRSLDYGKGVEGVLHRDRNYYSPLHSYLSTQTVRRGEEKLSFAAPKKARRSEPSPAPSRSSRPRRSPERPLRQSREKTREKDKNREKSSRKNRELAREKPSAKTAEPAPTENAPLKRRPLPGKEIDKKTTESSVPAPAVEPVKPEPVTPVESPKPKPNNSQEIKESGEPPVQKVVAQVNSAKVKEEKTKLTRRPLKVKPTRPSPEDNSRSDVSTVVPSQEEKIP